MDANSNSRSLSWIGSSPVAESRPRSLWSRLRGMAEVFTTARRRFGAARAIQGCAYRAVCRLGRLRIGYVLGVELAKISEQAASGSKSPTADNIIDALEFRFLAADEVRAWAADPANDLDATMAGRLEGGRDFCFAAVHGSRLVNYSWYALDAIEPQHSLGIGISIPNDAAYLYKAFTHPDYRGRSVHLAAVERVAKVFAGRGIARLIAIVEYANWASLRSHAKLGFCPVRRFVKFGG